MVGPCGLEPQTSTVSKRRDYVLRITCKALKIGLGRVNMAKTESLQVKLQVKTIVADVCSYSGYALFVTVIVSPRFIHPARVQRGVPADLDKE